MKIAYEIKNGKAIIWRCYEYSPEAELPDTIENCPVTELAPYAFSDHMDEKRMERELQSHRLKIWGDGDTGNPPALTGAALTAVSLPASLEKIGAYAFYNCGRLASIRFWGGLTDLGAGLFTGCHAVKELKLYLKAGEMSCLREILMEIPEKLTVFLEGSRCAKLVFPEFFEESVENTPARILEIHTHGSGMNYRNCFYDRKFDFRAYDACFYRAKAEEDFETVFEMALGRLRYPAGLLPENREMYREWVKEHMGAALKKAVTDKNIELLEYLKEIVFEKIPMEEGRKLLEQIVPQAASGSFPEGVAFLLEALRGTQSQGQELKQKREQRFEL